MSPSPESAGPEWTFDEPTKRRYRVPAAPLVRPSPAGVEKTNAPQSWPRGARVRGFLSRAAATVLRAVGKRPERPLLGLIAVPLAMNESMDAVVLSPQSRTWLAWLPLLFCAWWWAPRRQFRWTFLIALEAGALGAQWSYLGGVALATWPQSRGSVAAIWIGVALLLAGGAALNRYRAHASGY